MSEGKGGRSVKPDIVVVVVGFGMDELRIDVLQSVEITGDFAVGPNGHWHAYIRLEDLPRCSRKAQPNV